MSDILEEVSDKNLFKEKMKAYHAVYDNLDNRQMFVVDQMVMMFQYASLAYRMIAAIGHGMEHIDAVCEAGCSAEQFMIHFNILKHHFGYTNEVLFSTIDKTSDWLSKMNWIHLPEPRDAKGQIHIKTACGMYSDMKNYLDVYRETINTLKTRKEEGGK